MHTGSAGDAWIEDSVMITAEHLRTDSCHVPINHIEHDDHIMTHDECTPRETLELPPTVGEESMVSPPPGSGATTMEAEPPRLENTSSQLPRGEETLPPGSEATNIEAGPPRGEDSQKPLPLVISTMNAHPLKDEETMSSSPPQSNVALALPPAPEGEENKTTVLSSLSVHDTPVMSPNETMSLLSCTGREEMTSPQGDEKPSSQYQRLWSWDDAVTPLRPLPPPTQLRRAITCRNRPHPNQQQQFNIAVLRRGGGGSFHTSSFHHASRLPPSKCKHVWITYIAQIKNRFHNKDNNPYIFS